MPEDKKIIIDEDWKSQVQAEKEAAAKQQSSSGVSEKSPSAGATSDVSMPPASFELLLTMLATEALVALGHVVHPVTGKPEVNRDQAKYLIDMVEVLKTKTQGNLDDGEQHLIDTLLHQLRLAFVETATLPATTAPKPSV